MFGSNIGGGTNRWRGFVNSFVVHQKPSTHFARCQYRETRWNGASIDTIQHSVPVSEIPRRKTWTDSCLASIG